MLTVMKTGRQILNFIVIQEAAAANIIADWEAAATTKNVVS